MRCFFLILFNIAWGCEWLFGQCLPCDLVSVPPDYNSARISVLAGGHIELNFNTIADYANGKTIAPPNSTVLGINICNCASDPPDANSTLTGWRLYFDADEVNIAGQGGGSLPLCVLEAEASTRIGMGGGTVIYNGRQTLDVQGAPPIPLAEEDANPASPSRQWNLDQIDITYYCGVPPTNATCIGLGQNFPFIDDPPVPDNYSVNAAFTLIPIFNGAFEYDPIY